MPAPRLLVMEGNSPETRAQHVAAGGTVASTGYANLLQELLPSAVVDICFPGDPGANLPAGEALEGYTSTKARDAITCAAVAFLWKTFSCSAFTNSSSCSSV